MFYFWSDSVFILVVVSVPLERLVPAISLFEPKLKLGGPTVEPELDELDPEGLGRCRL